MKKLLLTIVFLHGAFIFHAQDMLPKDFNSFIGRHVKSQKLFLNNSRTIKDSLLVPAGFVPDRNVEPEIKRGIANLHGNMERFYLRQDKDLRMSRQKDIVEKAQIAEVQRNIASDQSFNVDGINYNIISATDMTVEVMYDSSGYTGNVIIASSVSYNGENYDVIGIGDYAFASCRNLLSVTFGNSITYIGDLAFSGCSSLISVTIPASLTIIGSYAFDSCNNLTAIEVDANNSAYSSVDGVLYNKERTTLIRCPGKKSGTFVIPDGVTTIGNSAFDYCYGLTMLTIPNSVTSIESFAFSRCISLISVTIPASVTTIGGYAFDYCNSLTAIEVDPNNMAYSSIDGVLYNKEQTTLIRYPGEKSGAFIIPDGVTTIGNGAFVFCDGLTMLTIPNSVTSFGNYAFESCSGLTSVIIPNSVTTIGSFAFYNCDGLIEIISLNTTPPILGNYVFLYVNITNCALVVPAGSKAVYLTAEQWKDFANISEDGEEPENPKGTCGDNVIWELADGTLTIGGIGPMENFDFSGEAPWYSYQNSITTVIISDSVTTIGDYAFAYYSGLTSVVISNYVMTIGEEVFIGCTSLTTISVDEANMAYSSIEGVLYNKDKTTLVQYPAGKSGAFIIPNSVITIGNYAFAICSGLTSVTIPNSVTTIGEVAFGACISLTTIGVDEANMAYSSIDGILYNKDKTTLVQYPAGKSGAFTIPNSVTTIGNYAFAICIGLTSVTIPNSVITIGERAFGNCAYLTSVTIGNSVTNIGLGAFSDCTRLTSVDIGNCVVTIGPYAFSFCRSLTSVVIPNSVTTIENFAFGACTSLASVTLGSGVTSIGYGVFSESNNLTTINVDEANTFYSSVEGVLYNKNKSKLLLYPPGKSGSFVIPEGVVIIDEYAFYNCLSLTSITIANNVTTIGESAFHSCTYLSSVIFGNRVVNIGDDAFRGCLSLNEIINKNPIPPTLGGNVFNGVNNGSCTIQVPKGSKTKYQTTDQWKNFINIIENMDEDPGNPVGSCGENLIWELVDCTLIISGTGEMTNYFTMFQIPWYSYKGSIITALIEDGVTSIQSYAFSNCDSLTSVSIGKDVTSIGYRTFTGCNALSIISVNEANIAYCSIDGVLYNGSKTTLVQFPGGKSGDYYIPNSVITIENSAFESCKNLTSVSIQDNVANIGEFVFAGCTSLVMINVDEDNANYSSINGVLFNKDKTMLIQYPGGKSGDYVIPNGVFSIGDYAFTDCVSLTSVTIPYSVTTIGKGAFGSCTLLKEIIVQWDAPITIDANVFYYVTQSNIRLKVPKGRRSAYTIDNVWGEFNIFEYTLTIELDGINYNIISTTDKAVEISSKSPKYSGNIVVPACLNYNEDIYNVVAIAENAFNNCSNLTSVTIPNSVTSIGNYSFAFCTSLYEIIVKSENPVLIEPSVFSGISLGAVSLYVPEDFKNGYQAAEVWRDFYITPYPNIQYKIISEENKSVAVISRYPIYEDIIDIPASTVINDKTYTVTMIDDDAFYKCEGIKSVRIPETVTVIGSDAFYNCTGLDSIGIPNSVVLIGFRAFSSCSQLTTIDIPRSVAYIGDGAFAYCSNIHNFIVDENNLYYCSADGILYNKDITKLLIYPPKKPSSNYIIPYSVKSIEEFALIESQSLQSIYIPNSVKRIKAGNFYEFTALNEIYVEWEIPVSISDSSLSTQILNDVILRVPQGTRKNYINARNWTYFNNIVEYNTEIEKDNINYFINSISNKTVSVTFKDPAYSGTLHIPETISDKGVIYTINSIGKDAFRNCTNLISVVLPNSTRNIEKSAFQNCQGLQAISIPEGVLSIGDSIFYNCKEMKSVNIPYTLNWIGKCAFYNCHKLSSIIIPDSVTSIQDYVFYDCSDLTSVTLSNLLTNIGDYAFYGCSGLKALEFPKTIKHIGYAALGYCTGLTSMILPNTLTSIGGASFFGCSGLKSISIPNSINNIKDYAFTECISLEEVIVGWETPLPINNTIFEGVTVSNVTLKVPKGTQIAYRTTNIWKEFIVKEYDPTSLYDIANDQFNIYPNPATDIIQVEGLSGKANIFFIDINGKKVLDQDFISNTVIPIGNLPKGMYVVNIRTDRGTIKNKLIKK